MKKIFFRRLALEVTRRCQLKCAHCLRGDAQDIDMSEGIIDALLDQTAGIGHLFFTGGEPTLVVDKMRYVLERMKEREIPVYAISYLTNGVDFPEGLSEFLVESWKYVTKCRTRNKFLDFDPVLVFEPRVFVGISLDNFHTGVDFDKALSQYKQILGSMTSCDAYFMNNGIPTKTGRGVNLEYGYSNSTHPIIRDRAIEIAERWNDVICKDCLNSKEIFDICDAFLPCGISVTATGIISTWTHEHEYIREDDPELGNICKIDNGKFPSISDEIKKYNRGKTPCYITRHTPRRLALDDILAITCYRRIHPHNTIVGQVNSTQIDADETRLAQISESLTQQEKRFLLFYKSYLLTRVQDYNNPEEVQKDFPQSNSLFCHDVVKMKESFYYPKQFVDWICDNKDRVEYRVEDDLIPLSSKIGLLTDDQTHNSSLLLNDLLRIKKQRESGNAIADTPACR